MSWVAAADGSDEHTVAATDANEIYPDWSPDGRQVAYLQDLSDGARSSPPNDNTLVVGVDGSHPVVVGHNVGIAIWSPDGRFLIAWTKDPDGTYGTDPVHPAGGGSTERLLSGADPMSWQRLAPTARRPDTTLDYGPTGVSHRRSVRLARRRSLAEEEPAERQAAQLGERLAASAASSG